MRLLPDALHRPPNLRLRQRGFTLIELVMVIMLLGVLAVFIAPRINTADFDARGFHDETLAYLRYAQKTAIAQRRTVCVAFGANTATLTIAAAGAAACPGGALTGPRGETPATIVARPGVAYLPQPADFSFSALGEPANALGAPGATQTWQVTSGGVALAPTITVQAGTGYVF